MRKLSDYAEDFAADNCKCIVNEHDDKPISGTDLEYEMKMHKIVFNSFMKSPQIKQMLEQFYILGSTAAFYKRDEFKNKFTCEIDDKVIETKFEERYQQLVGEK